MKNSKAYKGRNNINNMKKVQYSNEYRESKVREAFKDQKEKYGLTILPTTKIASLARINPYIAEEILFEMKKEKKIEIVKKSGRATYWQLIT